MRGWPPNQGGAMCCEPEMRTMRHVAQKNRMSPTPMGTASLYTRRRPKVSLRPERLPGLGLSDIGVVVRLIFRKPLETFVDPQVLRGHAPHMRFDQLMDAL